MSQDQKAKLVECPGCKTAIPWSTDNPHRPFCSEQCKNKDFVAWANQENAMPGNPDYEDMFSNELPDRDF